MLQQLAAGRETIQRPRSGASGNVSAPEGIEVVPGELVLVLRRRNLGEGGLAHQPEHCRKNRQTDGRIAKSRALHPRILLFVFYQELTARSRRI